MKISENIKAVDWGIDVFDQVTHGLPARDLAVVETPDTHTGMLILGHYLHSGLEKGETCALVTFDTPTTFLGNFLAWQLDLKKHIDEERLFLLNYRPNFAFEMGLTYQYDAIFDEIKRLCKGKIPTRIAIQQIDTMINLHNITLMNASAQKLALAANSEVTSETTILGQFVQFHDSIHHNLSIAFQKTLPACFSLSEYENNDTFYYNFKTLKLPWYGYLRESLKLKLKVGVGFLPFDDESEYEKTA